MQPQTKKNDGRNVLKGGGWYDLSPPYELSDGRIISRIRCDYRHTSINPKLVYVVEAVPHGEKRSEFFQIELRSKGGPTATPSSPPLRVVK